MAASDSEEEVVLYQDESGIRITNQRIAGRGLDCALRDIEEVKDEASHHALPRTLYWVGQVLLLLGPLSAIGLALGLGGRWWMFPLCVVVGFVVMRVGAQREGYRRRLVVTSGGQTWVLFNSDRPWGSGWYHGEAIEERYWKIKEAVTLALRAQQGTAGILRG
jgi:hypothetical protein